MAGDAGDSPSKGTYLYILGLVNVVGIGCMGWAVYENKAFLSIAVLLGLIALDVTVVSLSVDSSTSDKAARAGQARREGNNLKEFQDTEKPLEDYASRIDWTEALARNNDHEGH